MTDGAVPMAPVPMAELVRRVRRVMGTAHASLDCPCLVCATDRLCCAVEQSLEDQRMDAEMLVGLADLQRVEAPEAQEEAGP